jgi:hypothetical protein
MVDGSLPGYPDDQQTLAPSSIHRFISSLSRLTTSSQKAIDLVLQENPASAICRNIANLKVPRQKFEGVFRHTFKTAIFTKLAIRWEFS